MRIKILFVLTLLATIALYVFYPETVARASGRCETLSRSVLPGVRWDAPPEVGETEDGYVYTVYTGWQGTQKARLVCKDNGSDIVGSNYRVGQKSWKAAQ